MFPMHLGFTADNLDRVDGGMGTVSSQQKAFGGTV